MRTENRTMYKFIALLALITMAFWSCKDDINNTGYDLLLPGDLVSATKVSVDKATIQAYTVRDEKLRTTKPTYNLLGTFVDPVFGKTTADFACQFRLGLTPKYKLEDQIDSLVFYMTYSSLYGDTVTAQNFKVFELNSGLSDEDTMTYYQDINLQGMANSEVLGEINHIPRHRDSIYVAPSNPDSAGTYKYTDTITVRIKLNETLKQKIKEASYAALAANPKDPNIAFLEMFKGLYVQAGDLNQGGTIISMQPRALVMYSHKTPTPTDTIPGVLATYLYITNMSGRVNRFEHYEYANATFVDKLNQPNQQDSLIYLQSTGGLSSKIFISQLDSLVNRWKDSTDVAINKAEMILTIDSTYHDTVTFIPPAKLILSLIGNNGEIFTDKGQLIYPPDLTFSESYYGGTYNKKDGTYRFNLAGFLQQLIKDKNKPDDDETKLNNKGFYLTMNNKNSVFSRVVLKGATSRTGIRFDITYSRIK